MAQLQDLALHFQRALDGLRGSDTTSAAANAAGQSLATEMAGVWRTGAGGAGWGPVLTAFQPIVLHTALASVL